MGSPPKIAPPCSWREHYLVHGMNVKRNRPECGVFRQVPPCLRGSRNQFSLDRRVGAHQRFRRARTAASLSPRASAINPRACGPMSGPPVPRRPPGPPAAGYPGYFDACAKPVMAAGAQAGSEKPLDHAGADEPHSPSTATSKSPSILSGPVPARRTPCTAILGTRKCPHPDGYQIALPAAVQEVVRPVVRAAAAVAAPGGHCNDQVAGREMPDNVFPAALRPWWAPPPARGFQNPCHPLIGFQGPLAPGGDQKG